MNGLVDIVEAFKHIRTADRTVSINQEGVSDRVNNSDTIEVNVEMSLDMFNDLKVSDAEREKKLVAALKVMLGIKVDVKLLPPKSIARSEGKAVRIIDKRNLFKN